MSISTQISRLTTAKQNIKNEIAKLDVIIPDNVKLDQYHIYIDTYIVDFDSRLTALESKMNKAIYFKNQVSLSQGSTINERLSYYENKQKDIMFMKGD